jgi:ferredoxin-NADP reductase
LNTVVLWVSTGQWVELHSATLDNGTETPITNGFSIASDPLQTDVLDFAIKETQMPIVQWLHHKAKVDDEVHIMGPYELI